MTWTYIRQRFVMAAVQGVCAANQHSKINWYAKSAVAIADATLIEEAQTSQGEEGIKDVTSEKDFP